MFGIGSKKARKKREAARIKEFEEGKILQVDNGINNKEYLQEKNIVIPEDKTEVIEETPELAKLEIENPIDEFGLNEKERGWIENALNSGVEFSLIKKTLKKSKYPSNKNRRMLKYYKNLRRGR